MNTSVQNQSGLNLLNNPVGIYDNGHFSAEITSGNVPVEVGIFRNSQENEPVLFKFQFSDFDSEFDLEITCIERNIEFDQIVLYLRFDNRLDLRAVLEGYQEQATEPTFRLKSFGLKLVNKQENPISIFLTSTLWAILGLSSKFRVLIPEFKFDFTTSFELPINEVTKLLKDRQLAYRLLVIESATGVKLPFPHGDIDGNDVGTIAFCYHAIVDREFDWPSGPTMIPWVSNQESLSWLLDTTKRIPSIFKPEPITKKIFGIEIPIGIMTARIEDAVIENYEEAKAALSRLDNEIVYVRLRSIVGISRMISIEVPRLPANPWSKKLQGLIDLDSMLDSVVLEKFFNLASRTLKGLTKSQKVEITTRPDLNETDLEI